MKILLFDKRAHFRSDVNNHLIIDDERDVEILSDLDSASGLDTAVKRYKPEAIIVADNIYAESSAWGDYGLPVVGYITNKSNKDIFSTGSVANFGYVHSAMHLLDLLEAGLPQGTENETKAPPSSNTALFHIPNPAPEQSAPRAETSDRYTEPGHTKSSSVSTIVIKAQAVEVDEEEDYPAPPQNPKIIFSSSYQNQERQNEDDAQSADIMDSHKGANNNELSEQTSFHRISALNDAAPEEKSLPNLPATERLRGNQRGHYEADATERLRRDLELRNKRQTKAIAVYAAKGGVGKTTIATELAVYLSLVSAGRENYRVCLVDYNIDFGDVLTTLNLDGRGKNLTYWAAEIRERIENGEDPAAIQYTAKEIESYLQCYNNSSLYALVAPIVHEDSMDIQSEELECILRNITQNGDFDFVICDTGNNTRDSTVIALDIAQDILLIATQDVSAVSCDKAFLQTMIKIGFDTNKIKLVINNIMPYKYTQVSVKEVEDMFEYPCIARFKRNPDVTKANNCSEPIVYQPNHEFTKELRNIVAYLLGYNTAAVKKKKNIFSVFDKKRRN